MITLFASAPQFLIGIGIGTGLDLLVRVAGGPDGLASFPLALVIPVTAALVVRAGTLVFVAESFAASPAVHAFAALTHYTHGLEVGPGGARRRCGDCGSRGSRRGSRSWRCSRSSSLVGGRARA